MRRSQEREEVLLFGVPHVHNAVDVSWSGTAQHPRVPEPGVTPHWDCSGAGSASAQGSHPWLSADPGGKQETKARGRVLAQMISKNCSLC